jgi:hypothetical protein
MGAPKVSTPRGSVTATSTLLLDFDDKEQLARLADNVIDEVCQRECREDERREATDPNRPRCCGQRPSHQARASTAADAAEQGVPALPDARLASAGLGSARRGHADVWPVVRRHATAGRRGVIGSGVQSGSAPDDVAHRHGHRRRDNRHLHSLRERCQAQPSGGPTAGRTVAGPPSTAGTVR